MLQDQVKEGDHKSTWTKIGGNIPEEFKADVRDGADRASC